VGRIIIPLGCPWPALPALTTPLPPSHNPRYSRPRQAIHPLLARRCSFPRGKFHHSPSPLPPHHSTRRPSISHSLPSRALARQGLPLCSQFGTSCSPTASLPSLGRSYFRLWAFSPHSPLAHSLVASLAACLWLSACLPASVWLCVPFPHAQISETGPQLAPPLPPSAPPHSLASLFQLARCQPHSALLSHSSFFHTPAFTHRTPFIHQRPTSSPLCPFCLSCCCHC
jgi:hypothetical protein